MRAELIQLHKRVGKTMIYVTHDQLEAMTMSDRVAIMDKGRLQQLGTPQEVYNRPSNLFVAAFIGAPTMNLIKGGVDGVGEEMAFRAGALHLAPPSTFAQRTGKLPQGAQVVLGVRPEDVLLYCGNLAAFVTLIEPVGHETIIFLDVLGHQIVARTDAQTRLRQGAAVNVAFRMENVHMFDAADGRRFA
jgi:multiple sugar transport system ATP-binding protein